MLLEIDEIRSFFRARLDGGEGKIHLVLHGAGDAVQLPDELLEFLGAAELQFAIPEQADRQYKEDGQADGQRGKNNGEKNGIEG